MSLAYLSEPTVIQHTGNRMFMATGLLLLPLGFQQEKQAVEWKHEVLALLIEKQEGVCVPLYVWKDTGQTVCAQLAGHVPQTEHLEG